MKNQYISHVPVDSAQSLGYSWRVKKFLLAAALVAIIPQAAHAREQIRIVGSGTVYPFVTLAAEQFGQGGKFKTPIVEATGTGGGFKLFCAGIGEDKPDINDASRPITDSERETCHKNNVTDIAEIPIGYDGIVLADKKGGTVFNLTKKQLFMALARELPGKDGILTTNSYERWKEIDPALPDQPIAIYGPGPVSGTRDAFAEMVMEKGCEQIPAFASAFPDEKVRKQHCRMIREDGKYIESGEDYNITVQKLTSNEQALGIFGYSFYHENPGKIQASKIDGVPPQDDNIVSGKYGISRLLYVYLKRQHIGLAPGLTEFLRELTGENAIGPEGYITAFGLIPLQGKDRQAVQAEISKLKIY